VRRKSGYFKGGYVYLDVLMAMILLSILSGILFFAVHSQQAGLRQLSNSREASRLAESALTSVQAGQLPLVPLDCLVIYHPLPDASPSSQTVWLDVRATVRGKTADIIGVAPIRFIPADSGGGKP
jgi:type II secretory pathway pseudopilin PulG